MINKPSKWAQTWLVTSWEFTHFFKWKQELVSKLIMLGIGLLVFVWQQVKDDTQDMYRIAVSEHINLPQNTDNFQFIHTSLDLQTLKIELSEQQNWDAILIEQDLADGSKQVSIYSQDKQAWLEQLQQQLIKHYTLNFATRLGLQEKQLAVLNAPARFDFSYLDERIKSDEKTSSATAVGILVLLLAGMFTSFGQLFASVTGEKQQRVTEQLYACMSPQTWIDGKILGQMLHAIKAMTSAALTGLLGYAFFSVIIGGNSIDMRVIDWAMLPWFALFSLCGIYLCTAFMAAIAAAIDDPNHSAKTSIMLLPLVPIILTFLVMDSPSGWALQFLSYFPLTSFAAMPVRMSVLDVPLWQPLLSCAMLLMLNLWLRGAAGRLFKMGMNMYGKEPSMKQMMSWTISDRSTG
ncbi:ABC transporter permease [Flavobacterium sp. W21_SRS_FM6]|uniref:ABC transporter permease n=1 Tax=Flavobacterium sp. W21_SRS_FM6 TaxID=3240268 RepID=UPI003F90642F